MQVNEGNIILYGITPTADTLAALTSAIACTPSGTLAVAATMTCTGTFTFSQAAFEAGSKVVTAALSSANYSEPAVSNAVNTTPVELPSVTVALLLSTCDPPGDADAPVICGVEIVNSGNVGLNDTTVVDQTDHCPSVPCLAPGQSHRCNMSRLVSQEDFDAWDANGTRVALAVSITAQPAGVFETAQISNTTNGSTVLVSRPSFVLASAAAVVPTEVSFAGESVTHKLVLTNNGNVALRQVAVGGINLTQGVSCSLGSPGNTPVPNPVPVLAVAAAISCEGTYTFSQPVIELGDAAANFTRVASVNIVPSSSTPFSRDIQLAAVAVPNVPMLQAFIHHISTCVDGAGSPWRQRKRRHAECLGGPKPKP